MSVSPGVRQPRSPVEQHGNELYDDNGEEKEDQNDSDGLEVEILFGDDDLGRKMSRPVPDRGNELDGCKTQMVLRLAM